MSNSNLKRYLAAGTAALCSVVYSTSALALGTDAGTPIDNFATVDYKVGGFDQTAVVSPTTSFQVDQVVDLTVAEADGADTPVSPAQTGAVARFSVTNTGNATQDFAVSAADLVGGTVFSTDTINVASYAVFVDVNNNGTYEVGVDTATFIDELGANTNADPALDNLVYVFVVSTIPASAVGGDAANIRLTATAHQAGGAAALGAIEAESGVPDDAGVQVVFSNNTGTADDGYLVSAASLAVAKASTVLSDPLGGVAPNALAIPSAIVEYTITITNTGASAATELSITDDLQGELTLQTGNYTGSTDVEIVVGSNAATYCIAETGSDVNGDGCLLVGSQLTVGVTGMTADALANAPENVVVVRFQVAIN